MSLVDADGSYSDGDWSATPTAIDRLKAVARSAREDAAEALAVVNEIVAARVNDSGLNRAVREPHGGEHYRRGAH